MTILKFNVGSMNIFNTISKNIHCFRLKNGFEISNEIPYLGLPFMLVIHQNAIKRNIQFRAYKKAKIEYEIFHSVMT